MSGQRQTGIVHLFAAWLIALGLLWPSIQVVASENDQLSWLICSPNASFDLTPAEQQKLSRLGHILDLETGEEDKTKHTCPYQGCFGSQNANALHAAVPEIAAQRQWAKNSGLFLSRQDFSEATSKISPHTPRAPPVRFQAI